jgi:anti-anti-sigma regulatory factor
MLRIQKSARNGDVVFALSGRIQIKHLAELQGVFEGESESCALVFDLRDVTLIDEGGVQFLANCEAHGARLENCPAYIREWIMTERKQSQVG